MAYPRFEMARVHESAGPEREVAITVEEQRGLDSSGRPTREDVAALGAELVAARNGGGASLFLCDAGVVTAGIAPAIGDLMEKGLLTHFALDLPALMADWELATTGRVTAIGKPGAPTFLAGDRSTKLASPEGERPASEAGRARGTRALRDSLFSALNLEGPDKGGLGEQAGRFLHDRDLDYAPDSILARAYMWGIPVTVHATAGGYRLLGGDCDPASLAVLADRDFLVLANSAENLEQGAIVQCGTPAAAVDDFLAALALARNVAARYGRTIRDFTAARLGGIGAHGSDADAHRCAVTAAAEPDRRRCLSGTLGELIPAIRLGALRSAGWEV